MRAISLGASGTFEAGPGRAWLTRSSRGASPGTLMSRFGMPLLPTLDIRLEQRSEMIPETFDNPDHRERLIPTRRRNPGLLIQRSSDLVEAPADSAELSDGMPEFGEFLRTTLDT